MFTPDLEELAMTAVDARARLRRLEVERITAAEAGSDAAYISALGSEIDASRETFVGLAVTEIAALRAELYGAQVG